MASQIEVLLCYAQEDERVLRGLLTHLGVLRRQNILNTWHKQEISAGIERAQEIDRHLHTAQVIVLLVSQYFLNSEYCYCHEMERAMQRHERREARVIPVLVRSVHCSETPFAKLQFLPQNGKPVTTWHNRDEAIFWVAEGIRTAAMELKSSSLEEEVHGRKYPHN